MIQICNKCFKIYKLSTYIKTKDGIKTVADEILSCPKVGCNGELFECDELFAPAISILNKKGYITFYSCSGHIKPDFSITYSPKYRKIHKNYIIESYICFNKETILPTLPKGYRYDKIEEGDNFITIRKSFNYRKTPKNLLKELMNNALEVLEWSEKLANKNV